MMNKPKGFTLIELVLVISILGIMAVAALPAFFNVSTQARQASRDGVVGAVRSAISLFRANDLVTVGAPGRWPGQNGAIPLDDELANAVAGTANPFFDNILSQGIGDNRWSKGANANTYIYNDGTQAFTYTYDPNAGSFISPTAP